MPHLLLCQAASLFTDNNKYLAHVIAKGVKGAFQPVLSFYQDLYQSTSVLVKCFGEDSTKKQLSFSLNVSPENHILCSFGETSSKRRAQALRELRSHPHHPHKQ